MVGGDAGGRLRLATVQQQVKIQISGGQDKKDDLPTQHDAGSSRGPGPWGQHNSGHFPTGIQFNLIDSDLI